MIKLPDGYVMHGEPYIGFNDSYGYYVVIFVIDTYDDEENSSRYLHSDGEWRRYTTFNGEYTGYYETKEAAELALKSAIDTKPQDD